MFIIPGQFATRRLVLTYKSTSYQNNNHLEWKKSLRTCMEKLFGAAYDLYNSSFVLFVPASCDFDKIDAAISYEFSKHPILNGMKFRLQLNDKMIVV